MTLKVTHTTIDQLRPGAVFNVAGLDVRSFPPMYAGRFLLVEVAVSRPPARSVRHVVVSTRSWNRHTFSWSPMVSIHQCMASMPVAIYHDPDPGIDC